MNRALEIYGTTLHQYTCNENTRRQRKEKNTTETLQNFLETLVSTLRNQQKSR